MAHNSEKPADAVIVNTECALSNEFMSSLDFSDTAQQMAALKAAIFNVPETNEIKIQFIKEELSAGRYPTHSRAIAAKLLEHARFVDEPEMA